MLATIAGAVSETWFALGVQAPNYIFMIREQYQTKPDICTSLLLVFTQGDHHFPSFSYGKKILPKEHGPMAPRPKYATIHA